MMGFLFYLQFCGSGFLLMVELRIDNLFLQSFNNKSIAIPKLKNRHDNENSDNTRIYRQKNFNQLHG